MNSKLEAKKIKFQPKSLATRWHFLKEIETTPFYLSTFMKYILLRLYLFDRFVSRMVPHVMLMLVPEGPIFKVVFFVCILGKDDVSCIALYPKMMFRMLQIQITMRGEILSIFVSVQNGFPHGTIRRSNFDGIFCLHSGNNIESQNDVQTQDTQSSQIQTGIKR